MELEHILSSTDPEGNAEEVFGFTQQLEKRQYSDATACILCRTVTKFLS